jgi:hypothetical protein
LGIQLGYFIVQVAPILAKLLNLGYFTLELSLQNLPLPKLDQPAAERRHQIRHGKGQPDRDAAVFHDAHYPFLRMRCSHFQVDMWIQYV